MFGRVSAGQRLFTMMERVWNVDFFFDEYDAVQVCAYLVSSSVENRQSSVHDSLYHVPSIVMKKGGRCTDFPLARIGDLQTEENNGTPPCHSQRH